MPHDPKLADAMRRALAGRAGVTERKMFGGVCWLLRGNMLAGVQGNRFMLRVGKALEAEALARPGASPMDLTGKPMRGILWVAAEHAQGPALERWIALAERFVGALPPK